MSSTRNSSTQRRIERSLAQIEEAVQDIAADLGHRLRGTAPVREADVRELIRKRAYREELLGKGLFGDPTWDVLLELFACALADRQIGVTQLSKMAKVKLTTTIRSLDQLEAAGLAERKPHPGDRRRAQVQLKPRGIKAMKRYFAECYPRVR